MATFKFDGLEAYAKQLEQLGKEAPKIVNVSLYEGAKVLADAVKAEIPGLKLPSERQKKGLKEGLGVAHFWHKDGTVMTKIGFDGYNEVKTKRWPRGQPNVVIARALIRGTSWMTPDRFTDRAARKARQASIEAIRQKMDAEIRRVTND